MARRKDHTREELTQLAIDAGRDLVVKEGPNALTARRVATEIGYTAGTLYNLFENIDALAAAINIGSIENFADKLDVAINEKSDAPTQLRKASQAYLDFHREEPNLWTLLFAIPVDYHSEDYHAAIHRVFDPIVEAFQPLSRNSEEARKKAKVLWSTLHGICLLHQSGKLNVSENDSAEELVATFLDQFLKA